MRKTVEHNAFEWVVGCVLKQRLVKYRPFDQTLILNKSGDKELYLEDLKNRPSKRVNHYQKQLVKELELYPQFHPDNIEHVYVAGKHCTIPDILQLNEGVNALDAKADVYALLKDGSWVGFSVKQDTKATKSNYSVHSMFSPTDSLHLTQLKKRFLASHGFHSFQKTERNKVNQLFYTDNPYWSAIREGIQLHNTSIRTFLYDKLYSSSLHYPLYEFDSKKLTLLTKEMSVVSFEEHVPYYFTKNGKRRNAAKLFYRLSINEKHYRVEIRWKGDIFSCSPQFQIHEEEEDPQGYIP